MTPDRKPPVDWNRLKQIQDENQQPRVPIASVLGVLLLGLSAISFFLAFYLALDPAERIEPARDNFFTAVTFGFLAGSAGVLFMAGDSPGGSGR
jgi:hypothetical protein